MQVDWFTVAAQVLNFLVLVWLLKRFLYAPVMRAMARREAGIAERLESAERREMEASSEAERYREMQARLEDERRALLDAVRREADEQRNALHEQAREEIERLSRGWQDELEREQASLRHALREKGARQVLDTTRRVLDQLAGATLEQQLIDRFIEHLGDLPERERKALSEGLAREAEMRIETRFPLDAPQRGAVEAALSDVFGPIPSPLFTTTERFACGIELVAGGQHIAWTLDQALRELDEGLSEALSPRTDEVG